MSSAEPAAPPRPPAATWRYRPELDGLRTLAVVTIVFFHAQVDGAGSSFIVLDLFFVLSGFLVTNVVLQEVDTQGRLRLGRYYARRVRRLLPAAVVTIVATSLVFLLVASEPERLELVRHAQAALVYLANWQFIADGADYFAGDIRSSPFMHFWSLSVEEQYYIVFPLLVIAWWRLAPGRGRVLLGMLGVGIAGSLASQLYWGSVDPTRAYFATDTRLFQLLAGAAIAVALREFATAAAGGGIAWPRAGRALATVGLLGYVVAGAELITMSVSHRNVLATFLAGALVVGVYTAQSSLVARGCSLPWMTYLGRISYGIYLWHWPWVLVLERTLAVRPVVVAVLALVLATAMASLSHELLESPIRRGRWLDRSHWGAVGAGLTVSVLTASLVVGPILSSPRTPAVPAAGLTGVDPARDASRGVDAAVRKQLQQPVPRDVDLPRAQADRGEVKAHCGPRDPERCLVVPGDGPHVVLVGDSHARMISSALVTLAEEEGWRLSASVVPACPWEDGVLNERTSRENRETCKEAREDFYRTTLPRLEPDVVVLSGFPRSDDSWQGDLVDYAGVAQRPSGPFLREAVERTTRLIERAGASTLIVKSVMGTDGWNVDGWDPLDCLARAEKQAECVVVPPADRPAEDGYYDAAAAVQDSVATVDLNPVVCPDHPECRPIIDGEVVWRHPFHVSGEFLRGHRGQVLAALEDTGLLGR